MTLSRQQKILVRYLSDGNTHTTYSIGRRFLEEYNGIWFDLRKRASELSKKGLLTSDGKTPASYQLTIDGIIELEEMQEKYKTITPNTFYQLQLL